MTKSIRFRRIVTAVAGAAIVATTLTTAALPGHAAQGDALWTKRFKLAPGSQPVVMKDVAIDAAGAAYAVGTVVTPTGDDAIVRKYATDGTLIWSYTVAGTGDDDGLAIAVLPDGSQVFIGGTTDQGIAGSRIAWVNTGNRGSFMLAVAVANSQVNWAYSWSGANDSAINALAVDGATLYAGGEGDSPPSAGSNQFPTPPEAAGGTGDGVLLSQALLTGSPLASHRIVSSAGSVSIEDVAVNGADVAFVGAVTGGTLPNSTGTGPAFVGKSTRLRVIDPFQTIHPMTSLDLFGTFTGPVPNTVAESVAISNSGTVYVGGRTSDSLDVPLGGTDGFIRAGGWTRQFGTTADDDITGIALDNWGNVFAAGHTTLAVAPQPNLGGFDITMWRFNANNGTGPAIIRSYGTAGNDLVEGLATTGQRTFLAGTANANGALANGDGLIRAYENDLILPTLSGLFPANGQQFELGLTPRPPVAFTCSDEAGGSGSSGCLHDAALGVVHTELPLGNKTVTFTTTDVAGNIRQVTNTYTVVDTKKPVITIVTPAVGASYAVNQVVNANYSCADLDPATCAGPVASGAAIDTATPGAKTFTVNASDHSGNAISKTVNYNVVGPLIEITAPANVNVVEGQTGTRTLNVPVTVVGAHGAVAVDWELSEGSATASEPAQAGDDYVFASGTLSFASNESVKNIVVTVRSDRTLEDFEYLFIHFAHATGGASIRTGAHTVTILNDDKPNLSVTVAPSVVEGQVGKVNLALSHQYYTLITVSLSTNPSATDTAIKGTDYRSIDGDVIIPSGLTKLTRRLVTNLDALTEPSESISVRAVSTSVVVSPQNAATAIPANTT